EGAAGVQCWRRPPPARVLNRELLRPDREAPNYPRATPLADRKAIAAEPGGPVNRRSARGHGEGSPEGRSRPSGPEGLAASASLAWRGALRGGVDGVQRLARRHEQAVARRPAEADVAANLRDANAAQQLAVRVPHGDAAIANRAARIARAPQVTVDIGADTIGSAFYAIDHEIAEQLAVGELVVAADVESVHLALAAGAGVPRSLAGADDVELFVVLRKAQAIGIGHLVFRNHEVDATAGIDAVAVGGQFTLGLADLGRLPQAILEPPLRVARASGGVRRAFVELAAIGRIGEPIAAIGMRHDIVGRIETLAIEAIGQNRHRAVELIAHDPAREVLAGELPPLEIEGVAVAVVGRRAHDRHAAVILEPAQLPVVGNVTPHEVAPLPIPGRTLR